MLSSHSQQCLPRPANTHKPNPGLSTLLHQPKHVRGLAYFLVASFSLGWPKQKPVVPEQSVWAIDCWMVVLPYAATSVMFSSCSRTVPC